VLRSYDLGTSFEGRETGFNFAGREPGFWYGFWFSFVGRRSWGAGRAPCASGGDFGGVCIAETGSDVSQAFFARGLGMSSWDEGDGGLARFNVGFSGEEGVGGEV
jgi:hypothetical protein